MTRLLEQKAMKVIATAITYVFVVCAAISAQTNAREKLLQQFDAASWETRAAAFYELMDLGLGKKLSGETSEMPSILRKVLASDPRESNSTKRALIGLLARENAVVQSQRLEFDKTGKTLTEGYVNYYGDVVAAVASLDDARSVDALLGAITTGGMATRRLARLGRVALQPTLQELNSADPLVRGAALNVLSEMLSSSEFSADASSVAQIKDALVKSLADQDSGVRITAVEGVAKLHDPSLRPLVEKLATVDPYQMANTYPVREAASRALQKW
jgi:HEAT repeat protein